MVKITQPFSVIGKLRFYNFMTLFWIINCFINENEVQEREIIQCTGGRGETMKYL